MLEDWSQATIEQRLTTDLSVNQNGVILIQTGQLSVAHGQNPAFITQDILVIFFFFLFSFFFIINLFIFSPVIFFGIIFLYTVDSESIPTLLLVARLVSCPRFMASSTSIGYIDHHLP